MAAVTDELELAPGDDADLAPELTLVELLEAVPLHVQVDPTVDLDAAIRDELDPSLVETASGTRRVCISARKAGGRCTVGAMHGSLLCAAHSGLLDPSAGGQARARQTREAREGAEDSDRLRRLGTRGVIAARLAERAQAVRLTVDVLLDAASGGDLAAAKALIPWLNQGLGMPTETVRTSTEIGSVAELDELTTEQLAALVAEKRGRLRVVEPNESAG